MLCTTEEGQTSHFKTILLHGIAHLKPSRVVKELTCSQRPKAMRFLMIHGSFTSLVSRYLKKRNINRRQQMRAALGEQGRKGITLVHVPSSLIPQWFSALQRLRTD